MAILKNSKQNCQQSVGGGGRQGEPDALAEVATRHPSGPASPPAAGFPLSAAQLVIARRYDFPSWNRLRRYVKLLAGLGFDVNGRGRSDVPSDQPWQTALHVAAERGDLDLARRLLRLGADPGLRDRRFGSTPLGWARYFGQEQLIELLEPVTAADEPAAGDGSVP